MGSGAKRKKTYGSCTIDHFSPPLPEGTPKAINVIVGFEEALKLHLSLGQVLGHLNGYNRSTTEGKRAAVNLCVRIDKQRIAVLEDKLRKSGTSESARESGGVDDPEV